MKGSSLEAILETGRPRILNDLEDYLRRHPASTSTAQIVAEGMRSSLTCPLIAQGRPVGFVFFSSVQANTYEHLHPAIFQRIAQQLSNVLEKSLLYERMIDLNRELVATRNALREQATRDELTQLWNRRAILEVTGKEISRSRRQGQPMALLLGDIDHFKLINDRLGHPIGD